MAVTITSLTKGTDTDGNSTSTTASVTLPANCLVTLRINSRTGITADPNQPTATSTGATWVFINSVVYDTTSSSRKRLTVLRTMVASNQTGTISIDFGGQNQTDVEWSVETSDATVDTSGTNGSGAVVQSVTNTDADGGAITVTLAAFGSINNATVGFFGNDSGTGTMTAGSGFAALGINAGAVLNGGTEWKNSNDTGVDATFDAVVGATTGGIAIEVKAAPAYRSDTSSAYNSNNTTLTVTKPTGTADGDLLLMAVGLYTDTNSLNAIETITWPSGFTQLQTMYNSSSAGKEIQLSFAWKLASSEGANYTASWTNSRGNKGNVVAISSAYQLLPVDDSAIGKSSSDGTSITSPAVTAEATNSLYVNYVVNWTGLAFTPTTDFNERITVNTSLWLADKGISATGSTGTFTQTQSSSNPWISGAILVATQNTASSTVAKALFMTTNSRFMG